MRNALLSVSLLALAITAVPAQAQQGVETLLSQGRYWQSKGRQDLARQAFRRVLAIDPNNAAAKAALSGPAPAPRPAPTPAPAPAPRPAQAQRPQPAPAAPRVATPQRPAASAGAAPAPRPAAPVDRGGDARAAGYRELDRGNLGAAARQFQTAISRNGNDRDALGGLGIVRLREGRFTDARDLLLRASRGGDAGKWAEALGSARFYAGIDEANAAADAGRTEDARRIAEGLIASDFRDKAAAYDLLGSIYEREGRYDQAAQLYAQAGQGATKADPKLQARTIRAQALAAANAGDANAASQLFQRGILTDQSDPWIRYEYGRFLDRQGRRAEVDGVIAGLRNNTDADSLFAAALLAQQIGRPAEAAALIDRIPFSQRTTEMATLQRSIGADNAIARAKQLAAQGLTTQAGAALREAAAQPGLSIANRSAIAQALLDAGDPGGAAQVAQSALNEPAGEPADYEGIVRVLARAGQDSFALSAIRTASERAGSSMDGQRAVARLNGVLAASQSDRLREQGQYAQAFDLLQGQWNQSPGNLDILSALARLYQSGGLNPQAAQTFQMVLNQAPADKGALLGLIDTAAATGDYDRARAATQRAIALSPGDYNVYLAAARMERARGNEGNAKRYLQRARQLYIGQSGGATGGFTSNNPFTNMQRQSPAAPMPINPFNLDGRGQPLGAALPAYDAQVPQSYPQPQAGYAAPAAEPYPVAAGYAAQGGGAYPAQAYPPPGGGTYATQSYPPQGGFPGAAPAAGGFPGQQPYPAPSAPMQPAVSGDPVLAQIDRDIRDMRSDGAPRVEVNTGYRQRSGETGLSKLRELTADTKISTGLVGGRVSVQATAVVLDSGRPTGSSLARFGRNGTREAEGIVAQQPSQLVNAESQRDSGVALSAAYQHELVQADVGITPIGFIKTHMTGGIAVSPRLSRYSSARVWAERRAVTDSIISYAGTYDPVSGQMWGAVTKTGGGVSFSYDRDGTGVYADGSYHHYDGTEVRDNEGIQANVGGYLRVWNDGHSSATVGVNANYQHFSNNQNYFTLGHGGYFSPQTFFSVSFPMRYQRRTDLLEIEASVTPGFQSFDQDAVPLYPVDVAAQAALDALKAQNNDVRAQYDSLSRTGFGITTGASAYYRVSDTTRVGGQLNYNTFGQYKEFRSLLGIRQTIGGSN
ncbi:tetratricopeptide (TPR) repeat protein [Sphingomonas zeicaulis]|uniref:cellulose biosynthesis protein BcsC n=1 Tax=Sphingomonas zeicaulis TaxID=1632740 RepID=UPI003D209D96